MNPLVFHLVDVFAEEPLAGNQLAVFESAGSVSSSDMQRLARELNFSETTFIESREPRNGGFDVRIFTPQREVPFAGHPTLGTAYVIQRELIRRSVPQLVLNLACGPIMVDFTYREDRVDLVWMRQPAPSFGQTMDAKAVASLLAPARVEVDERFPIQEASTGLPFIIVPLRTLESVRSVRLSGDPYRELTARTEAKAVLVFAPETYSAENHLNVRVFAEYYGTLEDSATGSANGALAAYLAEYRYFGGSRVDIRVEQGYEIGRPSLLFLRAEDRSGVISVEVGGKVQPFATGRVLAPEAAVVAARTTARGASERVQ